MNRRSILFFLLLALPTLGWGYPSYIVKGYTNCGSCHYSPTGGGLVNSYGVAAQSSTFPDSIGSGSIEEMRKKLRKNDVTGYKEDSTTPALQWDVGLDARALLLFSKNGSGDDDGGSGANRQPIFIPMLFEVGGVLAYGPWITYGTITPRRSGANQVPDSVFSREH